MARPSNTDTRRRQIARGLLKVMAVRGYEGATVASIASAARVPPGIVHYHFKDKQEILLQAFRELVSDHNAALDRADALGTGAPSKVAALIDLHLGLGATADPHVLACWVLISGEAIRQPRIRTEYGKAMQAFALRTQTIIENGVREGAFKCSDPAGTAGALLATIQGYFVLATAAPSVIPSGSAAKATRQMAEGLLHPKKPFPSEAVR